MKPKGKNQQRRLQYTISYLRKIFLLFLFYFITARIGLQLDAVSGFATLFWLPTGISLAAVLLFGYRAFPGILLGAFFANFLSGASMPIATGIAIGNTLEAVVAVYFLKKIVDFSPSLEQLRDVLGLIIIAAFFSTMISATVGVTSLFLGGALTTSYLGTWTAWWIGDMISNVIVAPFLLVWSKRWRRQFYKTHIGEVIFFAAAIIIIGVFVFLGEFGITIASSSLSYIVFPPLIWAALRLTQREVVTATFVLSLLAVWGTAQGHGPFARSDTSESLLLLQSFMIVVAASSMILAAAVSERRVLEKRKDDFISFASHELKTPITSLKIYAQMLEKLFSKKHDRTAVRQLRRMDEQVNKLISLINNMLDVSKMQRATLELQKEQFSLQELVKDVVAETQAATQLKIVKRGKFTGEIYGDRERIRQVLSNLLTNAIKYSPNGKRIIVAMSTTNSTLTVSVKDRGLGISKTHHAKIFDRFYRVIDGNNQTLPGLGIGLYLSKMIIKTHGGEMWVESKEGEGSTFSFSLPRYTA